MAIVSEAASDRHLEAEIGASLGLNFFENMFPDMFDSAQQQSLIVALPPMQKAHFCLSRGYSSLSKFNVNVSKNLFKTSDMKKTPNYIPKPPQEGPKTLQNRRCKREEIDFQQEQRSQRASKTIFDFNITPKCFQNDPRRLSE